MPMFVNGNGSPFPTGTNPVSIATADLNGDGHLDLLTTNYISDNVSVLFGNGHGVFTPQTPVPVTNGPREVKVGDLSMRQSSAHSGTGHAPSPPRPSRSGRCQEASRWATSTVTAISTS